MHVLLLIKLKFFKARGLIDWSTHNVLVAAVDERLNFFRGIELPVGIRSVITVESSFLTRSKKIRCVKWNHLGDRVVMFSQSLTMCIYDVEGEKVCWSGSCPCDVYCTIRCLCWTDTDREIIT